MLPSTKGSSWGGTFVLLTHVGGLAHQRPQIRPRDAADGGGGPDPEEPGITVAQAWLWVSSPPVNPFSPHPISLTTRRAEDHGDVSRGSSSEERPVQASVHLASNLIASAFPAWLNVWQILLCVNLVAPGMLSIQLNFASEKTKGSP